MGGVTPTEAMTCHRAGVDVIKVFPASAFGGPAYLKALREPLPFLRLMPTGGVDESNLRAYLDAGAAGVRPGRQPGGPQERPRPATGRWSRSARARVMAAVARLEGRDGAEARA